MKNFEDITTVNTEQQNSIMRIRRMKKIFDEMENEIIELTNTVNCKCSEKDDVFSFEHLDKCDGSCKNYTLDEAIQKTEKYIMYNINKEYFEDRDFE
jgi:hypothetical protein